MSDHSIEKSLKVRQQEAKLAALEQDIKKIQATLKSLKTRLLNTQTRITDIQRNMMNAIFSGEQKMKATLDRVLTLLRKLKKDKRFSKADRKQLGYLAQTIQDDLGEIDEQLNFEAQARAQADSEERAEYRHMFKEFQVAPKAEEQADLRKLYLKLSKQFHPDKAANAQETVNYHEIQQQVVAAYQSHDLQTLLELESWYGLATEDLAVSAGDTDALAAKIKQLTQQLSALKKQQTRISKEIKALRKSEMGQWLTEVDSLEKFGVSATDLPPDMAFALEGMEDLAAALSEVDRTGKMEALDQWNQSIGAEEEDEFDLDIALFQMFELEDDDNEFYNGAYDYDEFVINPEPLFTIGSWVEITISSEFFDYFSPRRTNKKTTTIELTGHVLKAFLTEQNEPVYVILLSGYSLLQLPKKYLEESIEIHEMGILSYLPESSLKKAKSPSDAQLQAAANTFRKVWREHAFNTYPAKVRKRLVGILAADPLADDEENWTHYLTNKLAFPFTAFPAHAIVNVVEKNQLLVQCLAGFNPQSGHLVKVKYPNKKRLQTIPLLDLKTVSPAYQEVIDDYAIWASLALNDRWQ